ncbi:MAG: glutamine amidotransferase [Bacillota bacterium]
MEITICHLYPDFMNLYGDGGNVIALHRRALWHGLQPRVIPVSVGMPCDLAACDIIFMGGGQDREQKAIARDFQSRSGELAAALQDQVVVLAICGAYQLLGSYYRTAAGEQLPGLGLLDVWTEAGSPRLIGNVVVESELDGTRRTLVGFENHGGRTYLGPAAAPLGQVVVGHGNNGQDRYEGAVQGSIIGTYLHGALLPKNPWFTDYLLRRALARRGAEPTLGLLDDTLENLAHRAAIRRARG